MERGSDNARSIYLRLGFFETGYEVLKLLFPISGLLQRKHYER